MIESFEVNDSEDINTLHIVLTIPNGLRMHVNDHRYHLLFMSIASLGSIQLYIFNAKPDDDELFTIAYMYIDPLTICEVEIEADILSNTTVDHILLLDPYMFIQNPDHIRNSILYVPRKELSQRMNPLLHKLIPSLDPFIVENKVITQVTTQVITPAVVNIQDKHLADIYVYSRFINVKSFTRNSHIGISCLIVITNKNKSALERSLLCYTKQTHPQRELVIVAPSEYKSFLDPWITYPVIWIDGSETDMKNAGVVTCTKNYIIEWNQGDWYHSSLLSLLADRSENGILDYISFIAINGYDGNKVMTSYSRQDGWEDLLMIKREKMIPFNQEESKTIHMKKQWNASINIYVLEEHYSYLYVKINHQRHSLDNPVSKTMDKYYDHEIFKQVTGIIDNQPLLVVPSNENWLYNSMKTIYARFLSYFR